MSDDGVIARIERTGQLTVVVVDCGMALPCWACVSERMQVELIVELAGHQLQGCVWTCITHYTSISYCV